MRNRTASILILLLLIASSTTIPVSGQGPAGNVFYFHQNSILYRSENSSVTVIAEANLQMPNSSVAQSVLVASNIRNATTPFGTIWVGSASWVSPPTLESETIQGTVTITAWLSSDTPSPPLSGVGGGIAIIDGQNNVVGEPVYTYSYGQSGALTVQAKSYGFSVYVNRFVQSGLRFVFAVGLGGTVQGWNMKVYFDSVQYPSRAELPASVAVVSEPVLPITMLVSLATSAAILLKFRKRRIQAAVDSSGSYRFGFWFPS